MAIFDAHHPMSGFIGASNTYSVIPPTGEAWSIRAIMSNKITTSGSNYDDMPDVAVYLHDGTQGVVVYYHESEYHWRRPFRLLTTPSMYAAALNTATQSARISMSAIEVDPDTIYQGGRQTVTTSGGYTWTPPTGDEWWITDYGFNERVGSGSNLGFDCRLMHDEDGYSWLRQGDGRNMHQAKPCNIGVTPSVAIRIYNLGTNNRVCTVNGLETKT